MSEQGHHRGIEGPPIHSGRTVERETTLGVSPMAAFEAWADPDRIARWFPDSASGRAAPGATVTWAFDGFGEQPMTVDEAIAPGADSGAGRIVYRGVGPGGGTYLQSMEVGPREGGCWVRVGSSGFGEGSHVDGMVQGIESGWEMALATLRFWVERDEGSAEPPAEPLAEPLAERRHLLVMRPAPGLAQPADFAPLTRTQAGLRRWLGDRAVLDGGAASVGARLSTGAAALPLDGEVLCMTAWETLLECPAIGGTLGLKAFHYGPAGLHVGLDANAWGSAGAAALAGLAPELEAACDRLAAAC